MSDDEATFGERMTDLRRARRREAVKLRQAGMSLRDIGEKLGVSHPVVIDDLKHGGPSFMEKARAEKTARRKAIYARMTGGSADTYEVDEAKRAERDRHEAALGLNDATEPDRQLGE